MNGVICCVVCMSDASKGPATGNGMAGSTYHYCSIECKEVFE